MRDIRFKAKRLDNGEWVEGDLSHEVYRTDGDYRNYTTIRTPIKNNHGETMAHSIYQVDPSTVCQFTGLYDIEGNPIYEGDIVDFSGEGEVIFKDGAFYVKLSKYMDCLLSTLVYEKPSLMVICSKFDRKEEK